MSKKRVHEIAKEQGVASKALIDRLQAAGVEVKTASSSVEESLALRALGADGATAAQVGSTPAAPAPSPAARRRAHACRQSRAARRGAGCLAPRESRSAGGKTRDRAGGACGPPAAPAVALSDPTPSVAAAPPAPLATASASVNQAPATTLGATDPAVAAPGAASVQSPAERVRPTRDSRTGERAPGGAGPPGRRRVVIDSQASRRQQAGPANQPQRRPRRGRRRRGTYDDTIAPIDNTAAIRDANLVRINSGSTVKDVAEYLGVPVPEVIKKLMSLGEMATLTQTLSDEAIQVVAEEFGKEIEIVHAADDVELEPVFEDAEEDLSSARRW